MKLPPIESMARPIPACSSCCLAGGYWLKPPKVGTTSSHCSRWCRAVSPASESLLRRSRRTRPPAASRRPPSCTLPSTRPWRVSVARPERRAEDPERRPRRTLYLRRPEGGTSSTTPQAASRPQHLRRYRGSGHRVHPAPGRPGAAASNARPAGSHPRTSPPRLRHRPRARRPSAAGSTPSTGCQRRLELPGHYTGQLLVGPRRQPPIQRRPLQQRGGQCRGAEFRLGEPHVARQATPRDQAPAIRLTAGRPAGIGTRPRAWIPHLARVGELPESCVDSEFTLRGVMTKTTNKERISTHRAAH